MKKRNYQFPRQSLLKWKVLLLSTTLLGIHNEVFASIERPLTFSNPLNKFPVKGKVLDSEGHPLAGVTVKEKGTNNATFTNDNGEFNLSVSSNSSILVFSSVGFTSQELPASQVSNVTLQEDSNALEDIVVVGFGDQSKAKLTTAVTQVDTRILENRASPNAVNMLQGAAPGLVITRNSGRPGAQGLNMQIRGASSANGNVAPLIVIDGMISNQDALTGINPADIENISVLKDGGATAIYGAQSAGGVILVTTKAGSKGKTKASYSNTTAFQRPSNIPNRVSLLEEMEYMNLASSNAGLAPQYSNQDLYHAVNGPTFVLGNNGLWNTYNRENILNQIVKKSYALHNNSVQLNGGNENVTYLFSLGNMTQNGMFKVGDDKFSRWNARANINAKINKYLTLGLRSSYGNEATDNPSDGGYGIDGGGNGILRQFFSSRLRFPLYNEDGTYYRSGTSSALGYALLKEGGFNRDRKNTYTNVFNATLGNFVKGLQLNLMYSREDKSLENRTFRRTVTYYSGPGENTASYQNNPNSYGIYNYKYLTENLQATATYDFSLNNLHNFKFMGGYQFYDYSYSYIAATTSNLYVNDNPSLNFTADSEKNKSHSQSGLTEAMQSYFGRLNYDFNGKYLFETTLRSDESSRLSPDQRVKIFPSFSVGWNIAKENWFEDIYHVVNDLKLRTSWGKVGSKLGIGYFDYIGQLNIGTNAVLNNSRQTYISQGSIPATDLSWETVETRNLGLDFSFLNRKLRGSFDYFQKYNNNMLVSISLPATVGIGIPKSNDGKLKTWGWEFELNYKDKVNKDFNYSVGFNLADNQNKLIKLGGNNNVVYSGINNTVEGYALNSIWGYKTDGYFQTQAELDKAPSYSKLVNNVRVPGLGDVKYVDVDGNGEISTGGNTLDNLGDLVYLGNANPRYQFGINLFAAYKNFDLSLFVQGVGKRKFKPSNELIQAGIESWYLPMDFSMDYWTPENPNAYFPRPFLQGNHNYVNSDKWFLSGAYARLKNI